MFWKIKENVLNRVCKNAYIQNIKIHPSYEFKPRKTNVNQTLLSNYENKYDLILEQTVFKFSSGMFMDKTFCGISNKYYSKYY